MDLLLNAAWLALLTAPLVLLALCLQPARRWIPALLFLLLLGLDDLATTLPFAFPALKVPGADWNWSGKACSIVLSAGVVVLGVLSRQEAGLQLRQKAGSVRPAGWALLAFTALSFGIGWAFGGGSWDAETPAFQLTMPGLAEEIAYRGVFIGLLHRAFPGEGRVARWAPVLVTAVAFGLWHGLGVSDGYLTFDAFPALFPLLGGLAYGWLRERTGSVLVPILAHNAGNTAAVFGSVLG